MGVSEPVAGEEAAELRVQLGRERQWLAVVGGAAAGVLFEDVIDVGEVHEVGVGVAQSGGEVVDVGAAEA